MTLKLKLKFVAGICAVAAPQEFVFVELFIYFEQIGSAYTRYLATVATATAADVAAASDITPERVEVERKIAPKDAPLIDKSFFFALVNLISSVDC